MNRNSGGAWLGALFIFALPPNSTAGNVDENPLSSYWKQHDETPQEYIAGKFTGKDWVFLGEYHRIKQDADLVASLIPVLHDKTGVRVLALEFLCHNDTPQANKLITAASFNRRQAIRLLMRQGVDWRIEEYLQIYKSAWASNRRHQKPGDKFELLGLDPCYDFEVLNYGSDPVALAKEKEKLENGDRIMAEHLETGVLAKGRKALIYAGEAHTTAKFPEYRKDDNGKVIEYARMGHQVYRKPYKDRMFFIRLHSPFYDRVPTDAYFYPFNGKLDRLMKKFQKDIGFDVVGSPFEELADSNPRPQSITSFKFGQLYDGYVIFKSPIREFVGGTCIEDWVSPKDYRYFWRHIPSKEASLRYSKISFVDYKKTCCQPDDADFGTAFKRRFEDLPDIP